MPLPVHVAEGVTTVLLTERSLEGQNLPATGAELEQLTDALGHRRLRLDFSRVRSLNCSGLGQLVTLLKRVRAVGGRLSLHNVSPLIYEIFEVTKLVRLFDIRRQAPQTVPQEGRQRPAPVAAPAQSPGEFRPFVWVGQGNGAGERGTGRPVTSIVSLNTALGPS